VTLHTSRRGTADRSANTTATPSPRSTGSRAPDPRGWPRKNLPVQFRCGPFGAREANDRANRVSKALPGWGRGDTSVPRPCSECWVSVGKRMPKTSEVCKSVYSGTRATGGERCMNIGYNDPCVPRGLVYHGVRLGGNDVGHSTVQRAQVAGHPEWSKPLHSDLGVTTL
jgi:hypothetical protein